MNLLLQLDNLYADNLFLCHVSAEELAPGRYEVGVRYSHDHSRDIPYVENVGWMGGEPWCDIVLGTVRSDAGLIPCPAIEQRLLRMLDRAGDRGERAILEIRHG